MRINPIEITAKVFDGIEAVRMSGRTNMLDLPEVISIAVAMDFVDAAMWIESNRASYALGIIYGFRIIGGGK